MARKTAAAAQKPQSTPAPTPAPTSAPDPAPGTPEGAQPPADASQPGAQAPAGDQPAAPPEQPPEAPREPVAKPEAAAPAPDLDDYIAAHEKAAQDVDLVVTAISHPTAKPGHRIGVYSGFPIASGPLQATYSDGSTH